MMPIHAPSFRGNNLFVPKFPQICYLSWLKSATRSQQIFGVINTTVFLSFPQILFALMAQASKRQTLCFRAFVDPWCLQALLEVLVSLLFLQRHPFLRFLRYFLNLLPLLYIPSSLFTLKPRFICLFRNLDPISLSQLMISLGSLS
jgi:hypothetical protein